MNAAARTSPTAEPASRADEVLLASRTVGPGVRQTELSVPTIHCGACIQRIEQALGRLPGVEMARVNLSTKRVTIRWHEGGAPPPFTAILAQLGYPSHLHDIADDREDGALRELVRALAVAGFAAANIMMLSVAVWSGADVVTRDLFHWLSALLGIVALVYSGRIFFRSAWSALERGRTNMDVPISIGVLAAFAMSLYETVHHGPHAYFDAAASLLFFLLIGRTLDHMMRGRARQAVMGLTRLAARGSFVLESDGTRTYLPVNELKPGMTILLAAGERVPVDARVVSGDSELDCSLVNGESVPRPAMEGAALQAGMLNLRGPLTIVATATASDSFLADMIRLMEQAEAGRAAYRRIADRAARLYAPAVHLAAALTFVGWLLSTGDLHRAATIAIAVLIITCPCALGLAVPMVQVVAARRLFEHGILLKDGGALERLAEIDTVVFDKTGTLTLGTPRLKNGDAVAPSALRIAAGIAAHSSHPYSRALAQAIDPALSVAITSADVTEHPACGLEAHLDTGIYRLGRPAWALCADRNDDVPAAGVVLARDGGLVASFHFDDQIRPEAEQAVAALRGTGLPMEILSGDRDEAVGQIAGKLDIPFRANVAPSEKVTRIAALEASGHKVLMVGDGINDAPALAAAHASMAPATAADIGRSAADLVFLHKTLQAVPDAIRIARSSGMLVRQNLVLAIVYNLFAIPIAVLGLVTPLVAAIAMSLSSLIVVANALRLARLPPDRPHRHATSVRLARGAA
ncbi:heavy metal translocating P-type ATPase [Enhydrobacter sp.]|jgi:Cu2+-exporting ATPase|uniref:heavy metal translocating P-type ATPase n=1 Tax=Enhydrobacter sp. TaxID=1894999 RepID=UPI0026377770|nr:heavy metal translocating P-type ATPase [Enhydrobacter sp.]WIM11942.1 MAG: cadmium-translocating P-type ATPase [Enhydrobacter sp.]